MNPPLAQEKIIGMALCDSNKKANEGKDINNHSLNCENVKRRQQNSILSTIYSKRLAKFGFH